MRRFTPLKDLTSWRRIAMADWKAPNDPTVYGQISLDATPLLAFLEKINRESPAKITVTHFMAKAVALILKKYPDLNSVIKWRRLYRRNSVDIFLQVAVPGGEGGDPDLSGAKIERCDQKNLQEIARELKDKSRTIRERQDPHFKRTLSLLRVIPAFLLKPVLRLIGFLIYNLGIDLPSLGLPADPFGSAMVTSVGMWGVPPGFAPLVPLSRVPLIVCVGEIADKPWVVDGRVEARPILDLCITFDHRFMDGFTGSRMAHYLREIVENPPWR